MAQTRRHPALVGLFAAAVFLQPLANPGSALADEPTGFDAFAGRWTIREAVVGPWHQGPLSDDFGNPGAYLGKELDIAAGGVTGPDLLACPTPDYTVSEIEFAGLFEGGLAVDPAAPAGVPSPDRARANAMALGYLSEPVNALSTGCSEILLVLRAPDRLDFALDNRIYRLERRP